MIFIFAEKGKRYLLYTIGEEKRMRSILENCKYERWTHRYVTPGNFLDVRGAKRNRTGYETSSGEMSERKGANCVCRIAKFPSRLRRGSFIPARRSSSEVPRIGSRSRAQRRARNRAWNYAKARKVHVRNGLTSAATSAMDRVQSARARAIRHSSFWLAPIFPDAIAYHARCWAIGCSGSVALFFSVNNSDSRPRWPEKLLLFSCEKTRAFPFLRLTAALYRWVY